MQQNHQAAIKKVPAATATRSAARRHLRGDRHFDAAELVKTLTSGVHVKVKK